MGLTKSVFLNIQFLGSAVYWILMIPLAQEALAANQKMATSNVTQKSYKHKNIFYNTWSLSGLPHNEEPSVLGGSTSPG